MKKATKITRRDVAESRTMWKELAQLEGITLGQIAAHAEHVTAPTKAPAKPRKKGGTFTHPEIQPTADKMLQDLSDADLKKGFGFSGLYGSNQAALQLESELYNNWVELQCRHHNQRSPGKLTEDQFRERYWLGDDDDDDE